MKKNNTYEGLSDSEVADRVSKGLVNYDDAPKTKTVGKIIRDNFFNYFNFLNLALGLAVFISGYINGDILDALKNCLFMGVIIVNSIISTVEELLSKRITDRLSIISESKALVIRNGEEKEISIYELVKDDIVIYKAGNQIAADSVVLSGLLEVNESYITGESNSISKYEDDKLLSGSFVVSGKAICKIVNVGKDNYISKISSAAKYDKPVNSVVLRAFERLLKVLSILIIPIGILMLYTQYKVTGSMHESVFTSVAALIGMIPNGLILLTSSVMAVGVIKLYRCKVLVQQLYSIETLARVDTLCLDKTGTLTEGNMKVVDVISANNHDITELEKYLTIYASSMEDVNPTIDALKRNYDGNKLEVKDQIYFSSERKYSALEFDDYTLYLGAPSVISNDKANEVVDKYANDYRVVAIGKKNGKIDEKLSKIDIIGFVLLEDIIRNNAKETLKFFKDNNVDVKIISGDNSKTVTTIAKKLDLKDISGIDIGDFSKEEVEAVVDKYQVFGRVKPEQKKWIVSYLKSQGHVVAMTGDGVNDVMALKESDCAISIKSGTDAARNVSQLILLDDDFNSLPNVVKEGRQTINNIERSGSLLLVKTIYTIFLIIFSILVPQKYFFIPIQLGLITQITIGIPSFVLGLEPNNELVKGRFLLRIVAKSLPAALTVLYNIVIVSLFAMAVNMDYATQSTISVYLTAIIGMIFLIQICKPFTKLRKALVILLSTCFVIAIVFFPDFFDLEPINGLTLLITFVLASSSVLVLRICTYVVTKIFHLFDKSIEYNKSAPILKR